MAEPRFKGLVYINHRDWFDERLGAGWFTSVVREIDPEWPDRLLPGDWYSARPGVHAYDRAFVQIEGYESKEQMMESVAGMVALNDLNSFLRAFLFVATPKMFLRAVPKIWATYANFGVAEVISNETGRLVVRINEIPQFVLVWTMASWRGFLVPAVQLAGGKKPRTSTRDVKPKPGTDMWEFVYELTYEA